MGNLWQRPLKEIVTSYDPRAHPIIGPLIEGGPAALVEHYDLPHEDSYADACHLCYVARDALRGRFFRVLGTGCGLRDPGRRDGVRMHAHSVKTKEAPAMRGFQVKKIGIRSL